MPTGCLSILVLGAAAVGGILFLITGSMKSSDAYKLALAQAKSNPEVVRRLGEPIKPGNCASMAAPCFRVTAGPTNGFK